MSGSAKAISGAAIGIAITLVTVAGVSAIKGSPTEQISAAAGLANGVRVLSGEDARALGCQPQELALVDRVTLREDPVLTVRCTVAATPATHPLAQPVASAELTRPAVQPQTAAQAPRQVVQHVDSRSKGRSWRKTAMVIGGATAAAAGVGGLVGGKKGALVGAAIGGGGSTIYESVKR